MPPSSGTRMLLGAGIGAAAGLGAHLLAAGHPVLEASIRYVSQPAGQIFLRLLFMLVIPLVFSALVLGVAGLGDLRRLGRIGVRTLAWSAAASAVAVGLGVALVNLLRPGEGMTPEVRERLVSGAAERAAGLAAVEAPPSGLDLLIAIVPDNPVAAAARGDLLAVMFFSLCLGVGVVLTPTASGRRFAEAIEGLYEVTMRLLGGVIALAPIGVAALLFTLTAQVGGEVLVQLGRYVGVVLLALAVHQFGFYSLAGPSFLGRLAPELSQRLFPAEAEPVFHVLGQLGLVFLVFLIGLELMGLIAINVGYELGVIPHSVFGMLVIMAVVTTFMATPLLRRWMRDTELESPSRAADARRRAARPGAATPG